MFNQRAAAYHDRQQNGKQGATKIMATKKTANNNRQPKAIAVRTSEQATDLYNELVAKVDFEKWLQTTHNGALKLTVSRPELSEDNRGMLKAGNTTFYLVSAGTTKTALLISFRSYLVYLLKVDAIAKRLANFPTFDEWLAKSNQSMLRRMIEKGKLTKDDALEEYNDAKAKLGEESDESDESEE